MCGICGIVTKKEINLELLKEMNNTMKHRGPDDSGEELLTMEDYNVGLAQRRLSILDLSQLGHQPMYSSSKKYIITFNGEIYNYCDIKNSLHNKGYEFTSNCDTEVILAAYEEYGVNCLEKFNGMFAFAILDKENNQLFCARDRIGKKPFYYYFFNNEFIFGSELKAIMKYNSFNKIINYEVLGKYLKNGYINAPDTIFKNTYKLEPGNFLIYKDGKVKKQCYWNIFDKYIKNSNRQIISYDEVKAQLDFQLNDAVKKRMISDVPLGCLLSGGIDSSLMTYYAQKNSNMPIKTYSIGFKQKEYDEAKFSKEISKYLGTDHTELYMNEKDMLNELDNIIYYYDEPFADSSQIPTMLVSKLSSKDVKVVLSGDGGDELFCGYNNYESLKRFERYKYISRMFNKIKIKDELYKKMPNHLKILISNSNINTEVQFANREKEKLINNILIDDKYKNIYYDEEQKISINNLQIKRMILDMITYLPGDVLTKVDRASMKYSLEARCPLLDYNVIEYSFKIPHKFKYYKGNRKRVLKDLTYKYIPKELLDRKKQGFSAPIEFWLRESLRDELEMYTKSSFIKSQDIFNYETIKNLKNSFFDKNNNDNKSMLWKILIFQKWYDKYFK